MKALVILSGGMDSTTALAHAVGLHGAQNVETLTFNYGSKHNDRENISAKLIAEHYGVKNHLVALPFINDLFKSDLLKSGGDIPEGHYEDPSMKRTVVPFRNTIMLSIAAGYAESIEADLLYLGNHAGDHAIYPDCRQEYVDAMAKVCVLGGYRAIHLMSPFCKATKTGIARYGAMLSVPYHLTYSCYKGNDKHCGKCGTCCERIEAFKQAVVLDPTEYES